MNQKVLSKVFVWGFLLLYLMVACISFCHAIEFFNIGNVKWMSITLALAFEVGLALSLTAILLSDDNKKNTIPWILMGVLCLVQVIGNVYSVFKYISLSNAEFYVYLQKSLLFWIQGISQETVQVIVSWIMGAILPVVALMMTEMVASNIRNSNKETNQLNDKSSLEVKETLVPKEYEKTVVEQSKQIHKEVGEKTAEDRKEVRHSTEVRNNSDKETSSGYKAVSPENTEESQQEKSETEEPDDQDSIDDDPTEAGSEEIKNQAEPASEKDDSIEDYIDVLDRSARAEAVRGRTNPFGNTAKVSPNHIKNFDKRGQKQTQPIQQ